MLQTAIYTFINLGVIIDPVGVAAMFAGLTGRLDPPERRRIAIRAVVIAGTVLLVFAVGGDYLLKALGIGLPAFRLAGGALLFLIAIDMLLAGHAGFRSLTRPEDAEARVSDDLSVFPLAIPLIAGPGAMTSMVLLMGRAGGEPAQMLAVLLVLAGVLGLSFTLLLAAARIVKILGVTGINVVARVLGIVLAGLAAQLILDGLNQGLAVR